jgi:UDP-N-acetylmuramate dehydrogenase
MDHVQRTLEALPGLTVLRDEPLAPHTRFNIGGPADLYVEATSPAHFAEALRIAESSGLQTMVIGAGSNLIVADEGFRGVILKLVNNQIDVDQTAVRVDAGAVLRHLVDFTVDHNLKGLETMTGIPGFVGAAIYGNAGAYGHSIQEIVHSVSFLHGAETRTFDNAHCEFHYRESIFKSHKEWIITSATLALHPGDGTERATADRILATRNKKYPPTMKCAGSIFKNYLLANLPSPVAEQVPANVIIEGKVPSAWFLQQVGAKGLRQGDIQVADYHANLIYNDGHGTAKDLTAVIRDLKHRVETRFRMPLEEEVQYVGFPHP